MNESNVLEVNTNSKLKQVIMFNHERQGQPMKKQIPTKEEPDSISTEINQIIACCCIGLSFKTSRIKRLEQFETSADTFVWENSII